ncbi:MAG: methylated-DNA--[protein]-cysteine S-methyltransferase [Deltaproteobacteria bacterium]|nr:methylated-DNA--[protein]-cysteine S-methyltransferase [Deltaproteobacteria bacterium]
MRYDIVDSPIGPLLLAADDSGLRYLDFLKGPGSPRTRVGWTRDPKSVRDAARQLAEYFAKKRRAFDLPLAPQGTAFRRATWRALERIPYGETIRYGQLACRVGNPNAARAVGAAVGANPLAIVIPCHRVIGADGSLTGFGGGLPIKRALLELEGWSGGVLLR